MGSTAGAGASASALLAPATRGGRARVCSHRRQAGTVAAASRLLAASRRLAASLHHLGTGGRRQGTARHLGTARCLGTARRQDTGRRQGTARRLGTARSLGTGRPQGTISSSLGRRRPTSHHRRMRRHRRQVTPRRHRRHRGRGVARRCRRVAPEPTAHTISAFFCSALVSLHVTHSQHKRLELHVQARLVYRRQHLVVSVVAVGAGVRSRRDTCQQTQPAPCAPCHSSALPFCVVGVAFACAWVRQCC